MFVPLFQAKVKKRKEKKRKRDKAKISGGLMTLQPVMRSCLHVQWGGGERGQVATQPGDERGERKKRDG